METLLNAIIRAAGWSIIHSLWQGAIIYSVLLLLFVLNPKLTAKLKHDLSFLALNGIFLWFAITFYNEFTVQIPEKSTFTGDYSSASSNINSSIFSLPASIFDRVDQNIPFIVWMYITGLILQTVFLLFGYYRVLQIKTKNLTNIPKDLNDHFSDLIIKVGIKRTVQFKYSSRVSVPMLIGYFKPVILLPLSILSHLQPQQLEAVIIHELSHVRRNDYLLNLLKITIETILFFNPFVWLSSKLVDTERENVCDDLVLEVTGSPLLYAQTLLQLENIKQDEQVFAMAITGKKYYLLNRIKRIMTMKANNTSLRQQLFAIMLIAATVFALSCSENKYPEKVSSVPKKPGKQEQNRVIADTTAGAMKIRNKADVLELLKKLNIKPDKNGKINVRGETVNKIVIDGKEIDIRNLSNEKTIELFKKLGIRTDKNGKVIFQGQPVNKLVVDGKEIIAKNSADTEIEELIKKLPGIEVDKEGKITAQGQVVNKIVVDGKEIDKTELFRMQEKLNENMEKAREQMQLNQQLKQQEQNRQPQLDEQLARMAREQQMIRQAINQLSTTQKDNKEPEEQPVQKLQQDNQQLKRNLERVQELYKQLQFDQTFKEKIDELKKGVELERLQKMMEDTEKEMKSDSTNKKLINKSLDPQLRYADFLVYTKNWDELRRVADEMRKKPEGNSRILRYKGYGDFGNKIN